MGAHQRPGPKVCKACEKDTEKQNGNEANIVPDIELSNGRGAKSLEVVPDGDFNSIVNSPRLDRDEISIIT